MDAVDFLLTKISEELDAIQEELSRGKAADYAGYQNLCGQIRGLLRAEAIVSDLKKRMEKDDE